MSSILSKQDSLQKLTSGDLDELHRLTDAFDRKLDLLHQNPSTPSLKPDPVVTRPTAPESNFSDTVRPAVDPRFPEPEKPHAPGTQLVPAVPAALQAAADAKLPPTIGDKLSAAGLLAAGGGYALVIVSGVIASTGILPALAAHLLWAAVVLIGGGSVATFVTPEGKNHKRLAKAKAHAQAEVTRIHEAARAIEYQNQRTLQDRRADNLKQAGEAALDRFIADGALDGTLPATRDPRADLLIDLKFADPAQPCRQQILHITNVAPEPENPAIQRIEAHIDTPRGRESIVRRRPAPSDLDHLAAAAALQQNRHTPTRPVLSPNAETLHA